MQEVRCKKCNKKLAIIGRLEGEPCYSAEVAANVKAVPIAIEIKCPRCGEMNVRKENVKDGEKQG